MTQDRPLLGVMLMLGFCFLAPLGDGLAKHLGETIPVAQLVTVRFVLQVVFLLPVALWAGTSLYMPGPVMALVALRTALHILGVSTMFLSLRFLPLADALAIAFVMPFLMLLLGKYVLGEEVGPRRLIACAVGFGGTLMVIKPSFAEVGLPALLPLVVAVAFALFMLVTRKIAKACDPVALQAVSGMMASALLVPLLTLAHLGDWPTLAPVTPGISEAGLLLVLGAIGSAAHLLMTWSLRFAPSATLAPMQFLEIPFATAIGWLFFRDLPDGMAAAGIVLTIASGLYVILRERSLALTPPPPGLRSPHQAAPGAGSPASPDRTRTG